MRLSFFTYFWATFTLYFNNVGESPNMKIYSALQIGHYHTNYCEDYLFIGSIGKDKLVCAVMDGCSTALDSYFIATMTGKLLRKITTEIGYQELYEQGLYSDTNYCLKSILKELFKELKFVKNQLMLDPKELLTTMILMVVDKKQKQGTVLTIGDGLISINGEVTEFDHDNTPDYIGFHLNEDFEAWFSQQKQIISFDTINDISIATDGILSFTQVKKTAITETADTLTFLLKDSVNKENEEMIGLKLKKLEHQYGLLPTDDFAMIRLIAD